MIKSYEFITKEYVECHQAIACHQVKFEVIEKPWYLPGIFVHFERVEVTHETSFISYDLQSLICEIGGVIGMFLGFSALSLNFYFADWMGRQF